MALQGDGKLWVGGLFTNFTDVPRGRLARITNSAPVAENLSYSAAGVTWSRSGPLAELRDVGPFFERVQRIATVMPSALDAQGTFIANNNVVSQSVAHLHVHVVPRTKGDGLRGFFWPRTKYAAGEAAAVAERLRVALAGG